MAHVPSSGATSEMTTLTDAVRGIDFLDLGASTGGSLQYCARRFGGRGLGIDIAHEKVTRARQAGFDVLQADASNLGLSDAVRYVSALDFFEHLPDQATAASILRSAADAATDFLFIRHPSFEGEGYLAELGLCQYWHQWSGHPNHLTVSDYCEIFMALGLNRYAIQYVERIEHSQHSSILPLGHRNQHEYDPTAHGDKSDIVFTEPLWRMQHIYVALREFTNEDWATIVGGREAGDNAPPSSGSNASVTRQAEPYGANQGADLPR